MHRGENHTAASHPTLTRRLSPSERPAFRLHALACLMHKEQNVQVAQLPAFDLMVYCDHLRPNVHLSPAQQLPLLFIVSYWG